MMSPSARREFDVIIFDLGGTLIHFDGAWPEVLARADLELFRHLTAAGLKLNEKQFLQTFRAQLESYYRERESEFIEYTTLYVLRTLLAEWGYPDLPDATLRPALKAMYAVTQAHWLIELDTLPTLEALRSKGYRLGLISNAADDADVQALVDKTGIRSYFERILTSAAKGIRKPNPKIFWDLLDQMKVERARAVMVGDTLGADILGANNAGIYSIWITRRADNPANRAHEDTILPDARITSLSELPKLLERPGR